MACRHPQHVAIAVLLALAQLVSFQWPHERASYRQKRQKRLPAQEAVHAIVEI